MGSLEETKTWLCFAIDCNYFTIETFDVLNLKCDEAGAKIYKLFENWRTL